jgi:hypothetical protein
MNQLIIYDKVGTSQDTLQLQKKMGYLPYGVYPHQVMVMVSSNLGDAPLWLYLMSVGGAGFFSSNYCVVKEEGSLDKLVRLVRHYLKRSPYILHGTPYHVAKDNTYVQILLQWDSSLHNSRCKQLVGTFVADHIASKITFDQKEEEKKREEEKETLFQSIEWYREQGIPTYIDEMIYRNKFPEEATENRLSKNEPNKEVSDKAAEETIIDARKEKEATENRLSKNEPNKEVSDKADSEEIAKVNESIV